MGKFLRENWLWILAPIVLVAILMIWIVMSGSGDESPQFIYNIF